MQNRPFWQVLLLFLVINFGALALGGMLQGEGPTSDWYQSLNKAPWTPPGWFFGFAWTSIMICFSIFMARLYQKEGHTIWGLFLLQFALNVMWNPLFFNWERMDLALIDIICLTLLVAYYLFTSRKKVGNSAWLVLPYFAWLVVATTLNLYALVNN